MTTVAVIDYGMGNIRSVCKALEHVADGARIVVARDGDSVLGADRVVLPGVGALRDCIGELRRLELVEALLEAIRNRPFLGICLGMQALMDHSEENGGTPGLGVIAGNVPRFAAGSGLKVPHMGWNQVHQTRPHPLWRDVPQDSYFYFVHSYHVSPTAAADVAGTTAYGIEFASALARDNVFAVQFHPEKSQRAGLALLANFLRWDGEA
ncbi:MAG: imidazole glycerol phosphate synthase subunit HisH [Gammaproteobacteria bacterium]|jgi:glutamine amidotransferase|nr:imidazole glycerol phosphate synthase subunit HisH [Gammaproteobacteria bacterium]